MFSKTQTYSLIAAHFTATDEKEKIFFAKNVPNIFFSCYISARKGGNIHKVRENYHFSDLFAYN